MRFEYEFFQITLNVFKTMFFNPWHCFFQILWNMLCMNCRRNQQLVFLASLFFSEILKLWSFGGLCGKKSPDISNQKYIHIHTHTYIYTCGIRGVSWPLKRASHCLLICVDSFSAMSNNHLERGMNTTSALHTYIHIQKYQEFSDSISTELPF